MPLGIDLGTTRTVVAHTDHGNYPVVSFDADDGGTLPAYPATIAWHRGQIAYGLLAEQRKAEGWDWLPSLKPLLSEKGPQDRLRLGHNDISLIKLLATYLRTLGADLATRSNLPDGADLERVWVAVPANADSNQRFLTLEGFRQAGFQVAGMLNEPAAAGIEYVHHHHPAGSKKRFLGVYDLGGGTFDAATVSIDDRSFEVLSNAGRAQLGGNDFDQALLTLALEHDDAPAIESLSERVRLQLLDECRERKEGLTPHTRRLIVDLGRALPDAGEVVVDIKAFYARCLPLVKRSIDATEETLQHIPDGDGKDLAAIYLVGGSCALPLVARQLRERFGRRIRKSAHPHAATAIGLAIAADGTGPTAIQERFTRNFGVWREQETGQRVSFDPIFTKDTPLPGPEDPPLVTVRRYCPVHDIGRFRYLECSGIADDGRPIGDLTPWDEISFPLKPELAEHSDLDQQTVSQWPEGIAQVIEEHYACDCNGMIQVTIHNRSAGYERHYRLRGTA